MKLEIRDNVTKEFIPYYVTNGLMENDFPFYVVCDNGVYENEYKWAHIMQMGNINEEDLINYLLENVLLYYVPKPFVLATYNNEDNFYFMKSCFSINKYLEYVSAEYDDENDIVTFYFTVIDNFNIDEDINYTVDDTDTTYRFIYDEETESFSVSEYSDDNTVGFDTVHTTATGLVLFKKDIKEGEVINPTCYIKGETDCMTNEFNMFNYESTEQCDTNGGFILNYKNNNYAFNLNEFDYNYFTYVEESTEIHLAISGGSKIGNIEVDNVNYTDWQNRIAFVRRLHNAHTLKERGLLNV